MNLKQQLYELRDLARLLNSRSQALNGQPKLAQGAHMAENLQISPELIAPSGNDLGSLQRKFNQAVRQHRWDTLTPRDWRRAPWLLWHGRDPLARHPYFLQQLWQVIAEHPGLLRRVIRVYLRDFQTDPDAMEPVAAFLRQQLQQLPSDSPLYRWQRSQHLFQLFSPSEMMLNQLVERCLQGNPVEILTQAGLTGELAHTGLAPLIYTQALSLFIPRLQQAITDAKQRDAIWQALKWHYVDHRSALAEHFPKLPNTAAAAPLDYGEYLLSLLLTWSSDQGRLRYPQQRRELVHHLLLPWEQDAPPPAIREAIHVFLLQHLGDPRVAPGLWQGVQKTALKVFYRWMVGATLETFFSLLDQCALDHQWRYRRAFWWAYYEQHYIDEAWLALGKSTQSFLLKKPSLARSVQDAYGLLGGRGIKGRQSVLLFRIKNLMIAEWSHGGRCHVWKVDHPSAPALYEARYLRDQITRNSEKVKPEHKVAGISHYGNETGSWQSDMAKFIADHTGIKVKAEAYMPN